MAGKGPIYRFGDVEVDPDAHHASRGGEELVLEPKAYAVLVVLLEEAGRALGRDELLDRVWGHRHVTPGVLNRVIAQLRKALGDDAEHPRYIQTLHSLGYRFMAEVERIDPEAAAESRIAQEETASPAPENGETPPARPHAHGHDRDDHAVFHRWRWIAVAASLAVLAALLWTQRHKPAPADASVAVLPFTTLSSDQKDRYFAEGLAIEMHDALAGVQGLRVAALLSPDAGNGDGWRDAKSAGERLGVATVLDASVRRDGSRLRISAHLSDTRSGYVLWSHAYDRQAADVFATQGEIAQEVVHALLGKSSGVDGALARRLAPTANAAAFDSYLQGLQALWNSRDATSLDKANAAFANALAKDKDFVRAQAGVCRVETARFANQRDPAAYERAKAACARARQSAPNLADVALAQAELHSAHGDKDEAIADYARAEVDPSLRPAVYVGMAMIRADEGRRDLALDYFKRALALRPGDALIYANIGYEQYLAGRMGEAIAAYRKSVELDPGNAGNWATLGGLYLAIGKTDEAAAALEGSIKAEPSYAALSNLGELRFQQGRYRDAAQLQRRATAMDASDYMPWGNLGDALQAQGDAPGARDAYAEGERRVEAYLRVKPGDAKALAASGWFLANIGETARARDAAVRSEKSGAEPAEVALYNAQAYLRLGDRKEAARRLADARNAGAPDARIASNPFFAKAGLALR